MAQIELLKRLVEVLESAGIDYMLTGSYSSSFHGQRRLTHDIDVIVDLSWKDLRAILDAFTPPEYYVSETAANEAVTRGGTFNVVDTREGEKIDFWVLRETPFDGARFARRMKVVAWDMPVLIATAEDTILQKLRWSAEIGGSERQIDDARQVLRTQRNLLDYEYMSHWATRIGVADRWQALLDEQPPHGAGSC